MKINTGAGVERSDTEQVQGDEPAQGQTGLNWAVVELGRMLTQMVGGLSGVLEQASAKLYGNIRAAEKPETDFSSEAIHKMLEIGHPVSPDMPNMEFNSFMPAVAFTATGFQGKDREQFLAGTLALFGAAPESARGIGLRNAVNAFPANNPDGGKWSWANFSDPMNDPLDDKNVYQK